MNPNPEFTIEWDDPADAQLHWTRDTVHEPTPSLPLRRSFSARIIGEGIARVAKVYHMGGQRRERIVNGYIYTVNIADPPELKRQQGERMHAVMTQHIADLPRRWREEFQPELERDLDAWRAFDLQAASWDALLRHYTQARAIAARHWEIHFLTVFPIFESTRRLSEAYVRFTEDRDEQAPYRLVMGYPSKTSERDAALWDLAALARQSPAIAAVIRAAEPSELVAQLRALPAAAELMRALDAYLAQYGERSDGSLSAPTWREDPRFLMAALKAYIVGDPRDPRAELAEVAAERERLVHDTLAKVPAAERDEFARVLREAQAIYPLRETHAFFIDQASVAHMRYIVLALAERLVTRGALGAQSDIFYLTFDELDELLHNPADDVAARVRARRADHERWSRMIAPSWIGAPQNPSDSEMAKFVRPIDTALPSGPITQIKGVGGSKGVARGAARIVREVSELSRLQPGDILVCATTQPPWTALFRVIGGLVTDAGGVLSHGAIVAREYKLPAVLGTGYATRAIREGQLIEVDGTRGVVTVLS